MKDVNWRRSYRVKAERFTSSLTLIWLLTVLNIIDEELLNRFEDWFDYYYEDK